MDMRTISLLSIRRVSAMPLPRILAASSRGRAARSMRTTAAFLAVAASGAGKEPKRAMVCVRVSVPARASERGGGGGRQQQRTVAEDTLELKLAECRNVAEEGCDHAEMLGMGRRRRRGRKLEARDAPIGLASHQHPNSEEKPHRACTIRF